MKGIKYKNLSRGFAVLLALSAALVAAVPSRAVSGPARAAKALPLKYTPLGFSHVTVTGELRQRLMKNMNRLEETKYQPDHVFLTEKQSGGWPGDTEGRTILGLVMDAQATGRTPRYLDEIIRRVPAHLNALGYMGTIHRDSVDEQQLSGNGWMLRGLCEYALWKQDTTLYPMIRRMAGNLFVPIEKYARDYPITPASRVQNVGGASGHTAQTVGRWRLSSDIGCVFIGMDGLLQALRLTGDDRLRPVAEQLVRLFLKVDLAGIKAQTHASLTALRGLLRYADLTGDRSILKEVEQRWETYKRYGMTENYANYNWFRRYDTWTEPCAIVDAFMVAGQLYQLTGRAGFRNDAELIYYNALCHAQRPGGGFGLDVCPGLARATDFISAHGDEAHWCCTMRGGEGLGRAALGRVCASAEGIAFPFLSDVEVHAATPSGDSLVLSISTAYPFAEGATVSIVKAPRKAVSLAFAKYPWTQNYKITLRDVPLRYREADGLAFVKGKFRNGDVIRLSFDMQPRVVSTINRENTRPDDFRMMYGPLVLAGAVGDSACVARGETFIRESGTTFKGHRSGVLLTPLYHFMSPAVLLNAKPPYARRIVFR